MEHYLENIQHMRPNSNPEHLVYRRGQFHDVIIGDDRVISIARTNAASGRLPVRAEKLTVIANLNLGIVTPEVIALNERDIITTRVPGAPLDPERLGDKRIHDLIAVDLEAILKTLASIDAKALAGLAIRPLDSGRWSNFSHDVQRNLFPMMSGAGRTRAHAELEGICSLPHITKSLVHGDLGGDNIHWIEANGVSRLSGVLDWDEAHIGDPAEDLASLQATFGRDIVDALILRLRWPDEIRPRIDSFQGTFALQQALAAFRDGDKGELADGLRDYK